MSDQKYDSVSDYLKMTRYTYNDLTWYFMAVRNFHCIHLDFTDPIYGILRHRVNNDWYTIYKPVIENESINI